MTLLPTRRHLLTAACAALPSLAWPQAAAAPDAFTVAGWSKPITEVTSLLVDEDKGFYRAQGLALTYLPGAGGGDAVRNLLSGQADVAFTDPGSLFAALDKGERLRAIYDIYPQNVFNVVSLRKSGIRKPADLKGKKIGVTAPGSSTNVLANFVLGKAGIKPGEVSIIGVGAGSGAVAAMRAGQIDAMSNLDPVITLLTRSGDLKIVADTRIVAEADKVFGGPMPAGCLYTQQSFLEKHPVTAQALANAMVRADRWIQNAGAREIINAVPENYLLGDRAVYVDAFLAAKGALSPDGLIPEAGPETARRALASIDPEIAAAKIDLAAIWTNEYVKRANAKYPKG